MSQVIRKQFLACLFVGMTMSFISCKGGDDVPPPPGTGGGARIDQTITCASADGSGAYATFFKPQVGWVGDPMPFYNAANNTFYLFFLQDWRDGRPNEHPVHYTTTTDYARFTGGVEAIPTVNDPQSQELLIGTGSFIEKGGVYYSFYTGHNSRLNPAEKIMIATSTDLRSWTKQPSRTFAAPAGYDQNNFRDPHVYLDPVRNCYVMLITTIKDGKGCLARYTSTDLLSWTNIAPLTDFDTDSDIMECSDIFKMGDKWYLTFSRINRDQHRKTFYRVAASPEGPWRKLTDAEGVHETFDGLFLYAGKTVSNGMDRYVSGWCSTDERVNDGGELGWAGALVTHKLKQSPTGRLYAVPVDAVAAKFKNETQYKDLIKAGTVTGSGSSFSVGSGGKVVFNRNVDSFKITMNIDASATTKFGVAFDACNDQRDAVKLEFDLTNNRWGMPCLFRYNSVGADITFTPLAVPSDKRFRVTIIAEKGVCVMYVNDKVAFTNRINKMQQNPWMIYSAEGTANFSDIKVYR